MPTPKQKAAFKEVAENHRSVSGAMRAVGYAEMTATKPSNLTNSRGWKELMETYLPDKKLLAKHEKALEATKWNDFTGERETDHTTVLKAVELGYKIKRYLGTEVMQNFNVGGDMSLEFSK